MPTILLLRHGQASFGTADYDVLSALGERQARAVDAELHRRAAAIDLAASGTMRRQRDTLAGLSDVPEPEVDPRLSPTYGLPMLRSSNRNSPFAFQVGFMRSR